MGVVSEADERLMFGSGRRDAAGSGLQVVENARQRAKFQSLRRAFKILDLVSRREGLTAKLLARELDVSLSTCYHLINTLTEEGYLEKASPRGGYRLGRTIPTLHARRSKEDLDFTVEVVVEELAQKTGRCAYLEVLLDGTVTAHLVKSPLKNPPEGIVQGFHGASHALALGKVLVAGSGTKGVEDYVENFGLEAFTSRTIVRPERTLPGTPRPGAGPGRRNRRRRV